MSNALLVRILSNHCRGNDFMINQILFFAKFFQVCNLKCIRLTRYGGPNCWKWDGFNDDVD